MSVIQNIVVEYRLVHRFPLTKALVAGTDFKLNTDGTVKGYGTNPVNELVVGVSSFDPHPMSPEGHGVVHSDQYLEPCSNLMSVPDGVKLVQDYQVPLRYRLKKLDKKLALTVNHYSIYPVDGMAVAEWQEIIYLTQLHQPQLSCAWLLCMCKAEGELQNIEFSDGSEDEDTDELRDFGTHALYQLSKFLFPSSNLHDKIHLNGMLTMIATHKEQSFDYFLSHDMPFMRAIFCILSNTKVALPSSLCNFAGIVLAKLEAAFGTLTGLEEDDDEEDVEKVSNCYIHCL
jgi:hypothetical protein